ncbi:MAG: FAD-dependent oxidoreductase, partial [Gemmataceae bacterium]
MDSKRSGPRVLIVGAGISGLSLAYFLRQKIPDLNLFVLEKSEEPGGKIWTRKQGGFIVEGGPNGFLDNKPFV